MTLTVTIEPTEPTKNVEIDLSDYKISADAWADMCEEKKVITLELFIEGLVRPHWKLTSFKQYYDHEQDSDRVAKRSPRKWRRLGG